LLRVAIVLPAYFARDLHFAGGGDRYPYRVARALQAHCEVAFLTFGPRRVEERIDGLRHVTLPALTSSPDNPVPRLGFFFRERFDVIHVYQLRSAVTSLLAALGGVIRTPVVASDVGGGGRSLMYRLQLYRRLERLILISEFSRTLLPAKAQARACVIRGGIDTDAFAFSDAPRERRVVQVGRIMPHKGIDYLIQAAGEDIPVVVAGRVFDDAYYIYLRKLSEGKPVTFLIDADDKTIRELYSTSSVTVAASVYTDHLGREWPNSELLGLTMLESMAVGTPVVCTRVGGMPEYVGDGEVGFVVPPNDPRELRARILELLSDPGRARKMGVAGRAHAQTLTWQHVADQVAREYSRVVQRA
jgi:glycosyltransferase involved in cell wall biosynthesis